IFYMTVLMVIHDKLVIYSSLFMSLQLPVGGLLLLGVGLFLKKMDDKLAKAVIWVGYMYYLLAFIVLIVFGFYFIWSTFHLFLFVYVIVITRRSPIYYRCRFILEEDGCQSG